MAPDKMSQLSIESSSWDMKARMTCIGHKSPAVLADAHTYCVRISQYSRTFLSAPSHTASFTFP